MANELTRIYTFLSHFSPMYLFLMKKKYFKMFLTPVLVESGRVDGICFLYFFKGLLMNSKMVPRKHLIKTVLSLLLFNLAIF